VAKSDIGFACQALVDLAEWAAIGGDHNAAAEAARRLRELALRIGRPLYLGLGAMARAHADLVAAELFISERTVEGHLANVYAKLGVSSKLELVRRADELAL
jgi:FixJ family two-component response regulator